MGCISSSQINSDKKNANKKNSEIEKLLKKSAVEKALKIKLLLLGSGESGKSTIAKQMKIIHNNGYTSEELTKFKQNIYENIIKFVSAIIKVAISHNFQSNNEEIQYVINTLNTQLPNVDNIEEIDHNLCELICTLWKNEQIKTFTDEVETLQVNQSTKSLMNSLDRIFNSNYIPTENDVLFARVKTTGIVESIFHTKDYTFKMYDVGGQRSERRKWIHCFDSVTGLIFVASLSDYNTTLVEDETTNRMIESLNLFESTCNSPWFTETSIIIFLNKTDLFEEKINKYPLTICFPEYTGANNYEQASEFIKGKFVKKCKNPNKEIYVHFTCATDTESVKFVFAAVTDTIIKNNLKEYGLY